MGEPKSLKEACCGDDDLPFCIKFLRIFCLILLCPLAIFYVLCRFCNSNLCPCLADHCKCVCQVIVVVCKRIGYCCSCCCYAFWVPLYRTFRGCFICTYEYCIYPVCWAMGQCCKFICTKVLYPCLSAICKCCGAICEVISDCCSAVGEVMRSCCEAIGKCCGAICSAIGDCFG